MKWNCNNGFVILTLELLLLCVFRVESINFKFLSMLNNSGLSVHTEQPAQSWEHMRYLDIHITERAKVNGRKEVFKINRSNPDKQHSVVFAIKQRNIEALDELLQDVSDPFSPKYGKYLSVEELDALTSNHAAATAVMTYLSHLGEAHSVSMSVERRVRKDQYITVKAPIKLWENMFRCQFFEFGTIHGSELRFHRALEYTLPAELRDHVSAVFNTVQIPDVRHLSKQRKLASISKYIPSNITSSLKAEMWSSKDDSTEASSISAATVAATEVEPLTTTELLHYVTPALLNRYYNIPSNDGAGRGSQAVYETIGQAFSPSDLALFQRQFGLPNQAVAHDIGGHMSNNACKANNGNDCIEANLDVQYLMAVAQSVPTTYYYWAGEDFLLEWIQEVADMADPPLVFSISYGVDEDELPSSYGNEFDLVAKKLGLRGVSILASSGDDGAVSPNAAQSSLYCGYSPSFPATSPYVTAVGGTMGPESHTDEVVCQSDKGGIITSGGGFSTIYAAPAWQQGTTQAYLASLGAGSSGQGGVPGRGAPIPGYNAAGRGYPDVSAMALNYVVAVNGNFTAVSGTSASSPVMAGMVALVNSARLAAGKSSLGWINPALYQLSAAFAKDITEGTNNCAANARVCCGHGYSAMPGWDPVTGLGSVDFEAFKEAMMELGDSGHSPAPSAAPVAVPGAPTPVPSQIPVPTPAPTNYPTVGKGWMQLQEYSDVNCAGDVTVVTGVPTGVCLIEYDEDRKAVGSVQYTCNTVEATVSSYSSKTCSASTLLQRQHFGVGCAVRVTDSYYYPDDDEYYSSSLSCEARSAGADALIPPGPVLEGASKTYVLQSFYDSLTGCEAAAISEYSMYLSDHCFDVIDPRYGDYSYKFVFPNINVYDGTGCASKHPQQQALPTTCEAADEDDYYGTQMSAKTEVTAATAAAVVRDVLDRLSVQRRDRTDESANVNSYYYSSSTTELYDVWSQVQSRTAPTEVSKSPSRSPTETPTILPTALPTALATGKPTAQPSLKDQPSHYPSAAPTLTPTTSQRPTVVPSTSTPTTAAPSTAPSVTAPTIAPSLSKTQSPTAFSPLPQPVNLIVTMEVNQAMQGITAKVFRQAGSGAETVFKHAVAKTMISVEPADIAIKSVFDGSITTSAGADNNAAGKFLFADTKLNVCIVAYALRFNTLDAGYSDAAAAYRGVSSQLTGSIADGSFDTFLHEYAVIYQEASLRDAFTPDSSDAISTTYTVAEPPNDDADQHGRSLGAAAMVLIAVFGSLVLLTAVCFLVRRGKGGLWGAAGRYAELGADSVHDPHASAAGDNASAEGERRASPRMSLSRLAASSILGRRLFSRKHAVPEDAVHTPGVFTIESDLHDEEAALSHNPVLLAAAHEDGDIELK